MARVGRWRKIVGTRLQGSEVVVVLPFSVKRGFDCFMLSEKCFSQDSVGNRPSWWRNEVERKKKRVGESFLNFGVNKRFPFVWVKPYKHWREFRVKSVLLYISGI